VRLVSVDKSGTITTLNFTSREPNCSMSAEALYALCWNEDWHAAIVHLSSRSDEAAVDQLFYKRHGWPLIIRACRLSAPLDLVQLMIATGTAKLDTRKRCLLAMSYSNAVTPLHFAAASCNEPAVLELLIREHPLALCATTGWGRTPLQLATLYNHLDPIINLLRDTAAALASRSFAALAGRVHGDSHTLRRLCLALPACCRGPSRAPPAVPQARALDRLPYDRVGDHARPRIIFSFL